MATLRSEEAWLKCSFRPCLVGSRLGKSCRHVQSLLYRRRHSLYSITTNQAAIAVLFRIMNQHVGNLPPMMLT